MIDRAVVRRHLPAELAQDRTASRAAPAGAGEGADGARADAGEEITVDLEARTAGGFPFELDDFSRECLLGGLDDIALTLRDERMLTAYEATHAAPISTVSL